MPGKVRDEALFPAVMAARGPGALEETAEQSLSTETPEFCSGSVQGGQVEGGVRTGRVPGGSQQTKCGDSSPGCGAEED